MRLVFVLCTLFAVFACTNENYHSSLNPENLPKQVYQVDPTKDTVLKTEKGALLEIEKGSLQVSSGYVSLEVKEAYSLEDIIRAGLTTQSNGLPLRSGGMIYIDVVDKKVTIAKPIKISLPTKNYDAEMQLFRGEEKDGKFNWTAPTILNSSIQEYTTGGREMFLANCATCHSVDTPLTGPALRGVGERGPWRKLSELVKWTRNPGAYIPTTAYTRCLTAEYNGQIMPSFPQLSDKELNAIYDYIKYAPITTNDVGKEERPSDCIDSCRVFDSVRSISLERVSRLEDSRQVFINANENRINFERMNDSGTAPLVNLRDMRGEVEKVAPIDYKAVYYRFDITSFGWYNIDALQEYAEDDASVLELRVDESLSSRIDVFIVVPKYKTFDRGGKLANGVSYGFFTLDGKLPLPIGEKVVVFALSEANDKILFDFKEFIATSVNEIQLVPKEYTKEDFNKAIQSFVPPTIKIKAADSKNATEIRRLDKEIKIQNEKMELVRPKGCHCDCTESSDTTAYKY